MRLNFAGPLLHLEPEEAQGQGMLRKFMSSDGVQQGDMVGSTVFALTSSDAVAGSS